LSGTWILDGRVCDALIGRASMAILYLEEGCTVNISEFINGSLLFSHILLVHSSVLFPCEHMVANNLDTALHWCVLIKSEANVIIFTIKDKLNWACPSLTFKFTIYTFVCLIIAQY
jgi:hypothetical protein